MTLVSQSEFARLCGVSRQAVLKWKTVGMLVLQGNRVDVEETDAYMRKYHKTGSPLQRKPVDTIDTRLTNVNQRGGQLTKSQPGLSTAQRLSDLDNTLEFDFSRAGLRERVTEAALSLGFNPKIDGDDIELWREGDIWIACDEDPFEISAYAALDLMRWWMNDDPIIGGDDDSRRLLARPFGTPETEAACFEVS